MNDIKKLELSVLVDMLAANTAKYMKMLKDGFTQEEYNNCKELINRLSAEIESRKAKNNSAAKSELTRKSL